MLATKRAAWPLTLILLVLVGCVRAGVIPSHNPNALLRKGAESPSAPIDFGGTQIVLCYSGNRSLAPTGALLDDSVAFSGPVTRLYLIPEPGLALFEKIAESLARHNARVLRQYGASRYPDHLSADGAVYLYITLTEFEAHHWRVKDNGGLNLGRANILYEIAGGSISSEPVPITVSCKVPETTDVFEALANAFTSALVDTVKGGLGTSHAS